MKKYIMMLALMLIGFLSYSQHTIEGDLDVHGQQINLNNNVNEVTIDIDPVDSTLITTDGKLIINAKDSIIFEDIVVMDNMLVNDTMRIGSDTITELSQDPTLADSSSTAIVSEAAIKAAIKEYVDNNTTEPAGLSGDIQFNDGAGGFGASDSLNWSGGELFVEGALNINQGAYSYLGSTVLSRIYNNRGSVIKTTEAGAVSLNDYNNALGANLGSQNFNSYFVDYNFASTQNSSGLSGKQYLTFDQNGTNSQPFTRMGINCLNSGFNTLLRIELDKHGSNLSTNTTIIDVVDNYGSHDVDLAGATKIKTGLKIDLNNSFTTTTTGTGLSRSLWLNAEGGDENQAIYVENGSVSIGTEDADAKLQVKSPSSLGLENALLIENGNGDDLLTVVDDGFVGVGIGAPLTTEKMRVLGNFRANGFIYPGASANTYFGSNAINISTNAFIDGNVTNVCRVATSALGRIQLTNNSATAVGFENYPAGGETWVSKTASTASAVNNYDAKVYITGRYWNGSASIDRNADIHHLFDAGANPLSRLALGIGGNIYMNIVSDGTFEYNALKEDKRSITIADDATYDLPVGVSGHLKVIYGDSEGFIDFYFKADATWIGETNINVSTTSVDGNFCVFDNGTNIRIENKTGVAKVVKIIANY